MSRTTALARRLGRAIRADPFTAVEAGLVVALALGLAFAFGMAAAPVEEPAQDAGLLGFVVFLAVPLPLIAVLLVHACYDAWRLVRADDRLPGTVPEILRAGWRALETAVAIGFLVVAAFALLLLVALPEAPENSEGLFGLVVVVVVTVAMLSYVPVVIVAVRLSAAGALRGYRLATGEERPR